MSRITKRDILILSVFLVVVVAGSGFAVLARVGGASSPSADEEILSQAATVLVSDKPIEASGGLVYEGDGIADPKAFEPAKGGLPGVFAAAVAANTPSGGSRTKPGSTQAGPSGGGQPSGPGAGSSMGGGVRPPGGGGPSAGGTPGEARVYIAALVGEGDSIRALVVQKESGDTRWVNSGESAFGYTLEYATMKGAVVERNGQRYVLPLGKGATTKSSTGPASQGGPTTQGGGESAGPAEGGVAEKIIGTWTGSMQGMSMTFTYNRGGSGSMTVSQMPTPISFRWSINGSKMHIDVEFGGMSQSDDIDFRLEGDRTLILSGGRMGGMGGELRLTKQ